MDDPVLAEDFYDYRNHNVYFYEYHIHGSELYQYNYNEDGVLIYKIKLPDCYTEEYRKYERLSNGRQ